ncbi:MAG TPA: ADP-ribosylglycohydrolase family protein [Terriglobales bacterium]|nr:ADP-ribosylglycohydrolase family protein [Terriglobales bacterium]
MKRPTENEFAGCLIGQCLGDALGFPVEGESPEVCQSYVHDFVRTGRVVKQCRGRYRFGQYSDDSQLARELMQSFVACGGFDPRDYADRIAAIFVEERIVGQGFATQAAAFRLAAGLAWEEAGTPPPAAGNGAAMRAGPVGLLFSGDPERMVHVAHEQSRITHKDARCSAGAILIAGSVALILRHTPTKLPEFTDQLAGWVAPFDPALASALPRMEKWLQSEPEVAVREISRIGLDPDHVDAWQHISPFVTTSVLWSLYSFLKHPDNYLEAIGTAIAAGGDVDTTAAMTGAISGARVGLEELPMDLVQLLNDNETWRYEELVELSRKCHSMVMAARNPR